MGVPSPQVRPTTIDPFAALDKNTAHLSQDELSNRFPSVEQFSLLHDSGSKFQFMDDKSPGAGQGFDENLAERLAEDAFATVSSPKAGLLRSTSTELLSQPQSISRGATGTSNYVRPVLYEPQPKRPVMVSTGTMTSPSPPRSPPRHEPLPQSQKLTTPPSSSTHDRVSESYIRQEQPQRPALLDVGRSQTHVLISSTSQPSSSRPSLEMSRALSSTDIGEPIRSKSANAKPRPHSVYVESNLEFLRDLDSPSSQGTSTGGFPPIAGLQLQHSGRSVSSMRSEHIDSNVVFLQVMEAEADANKPEKRNITSNFVGKHVKRASMPSISLPKNKLGGKFGDAFRRFERGNAGNNNGPEPVRTPSPERNSHSNGASPIDDEWEVSSQDIPPEVKRELEKRQLSQEEKRVAAAAAEYKRQLASRAEGEPVRRTRANSIQKRVHALLNETNKEPPPKTAEGYGRYTAEAPVSQLPNGSSASSTTPANKPESYRITQSSTGYRPSTPVSAASVAAAAAAAKVVRKPVGPTPTPTPTPPAAASAARPPPPPKPKKLRTGGGSSNSASPVMQQQQMQQPDEDWERNFAKRYPSLSGLEISDDSAGAAGGGGGGARRS